MTKKTLLIVNDNLQIGGIQKSLVNLLNSISNEYEVSLLLFNCAGALIQRVPKNVTLIIANKRYQILGMNKDELKRKPIAFIEKCFFEIITRLFTKEVALKILSIGISKIESDIAISYSHLTDYKTFKNGCGEFVLNNVKAKNKVCYIHCDYMNSKTQSKCNDKIYRRFDRIICCSNSVKDAFLLYNICLKDKTYVVRNFPDESILQESHDIDTIFNKEYINILSIGRLSSEKGFLRVIKALKKIKRNDIKYYIIGSGPQKKELVREIELNHLNDKVFLLNEKENPYEYLKKCDYLIVPSYHEAAPIVYDEAAIINKRIISTKTLSTCEMLNTRDIVCDNNDNSICNILSTIEKPNEIYYSKKIEKNYKIFLGNRMLEFNNVMNGF